MKSNIKQLPFLNNFSLVSAWHRDKALDINLQNQEQLKSNIVNLDLNIIELKSHIRYVNGNEDGFYEERFFFVPEVNLFELMLLGVKYQQSSVFYREQTTIKVLDTKVGRVLSSIPFSKGNQLNELKCACIAYVQSRNNTVSIVLDIILEKLPNSLNSDSLFHVNINQEILSSE